MFEDQNIRLRKLAATDYQLYHRWRNDTEVMQSTSPYLDLYTEQETEQFVSMIASQPDAKGYLIELKQTEQSVGIVSLINIDWKNRSAECIIDIGDKNMWGKGIGTSALSLIQRYAFNELNLNRLYLRVFSFHHRAIKLYEKLGFVREGVLRQGLYRGGEWHDITLMSLLQAEYRQANR